MMETEDHAQNAGGHPDDPEHHCPGGQGERTDMAGSGVGRPRCCRRGRRPGVAGRRPGQFLRLEVSFGLGGPWRAPSSGRLPGQPERGRGPFLGRDRPDCRSQRSSGDAGPPADRGAVTGQDGTEPDRPGTGVGSHHRSEIGHHQGVLALHALDHGEEVVDVEGGAVAHGQPAEPRGLDGLVGQVPQLTWAWFAVWIPLPPTRRPG